MTTMARVTMTSTKTTHLTTKADDVTVISGETVHTIVVSTPITTEEGDKVTVVTTTHIKQK